MTIREHIIENARPEHREAVRRALDEVGMDAFAAEITPRLATVFTRMRETMDRMGRAEAMLAEVAR